jgi:ribosome recycling factor
MDQHIQAAKKEFAQAIDHLTEEFRGLQIGRANASLVDNIMVSAYGSEQPLKSVANISTPDGQTIAIRAWDKSMVTAIEKAIITSHLGLNPSNDGDTIRLSIPPLTEERRRELTKIVHQMAENAHIHVRNSRQKCLDKIKSMAKEKEITEDDQRLGEKNLQEAVDEANKEIKALSQKKENDIMTV